MIRRGTCLVCGGEDVEITGGIVEWVEPVEGVIFSAIERCRDRVACRARLEGIGDAWPIRDGTPSSVRLTVTDEEARAWL